jgi:hypothetical protein
MDKQNDKKEEDEIVMVGPGADEPDEELDDDGKPVKEPERKNSKEPDDEEDEVEDARAGHGDDDEEEEEEDGKLSPREQRKLRKERQKRARERSQRELKFLRQRNETLEKQHNELSNRVTATESMTVDQRISALESQLTIAQNVEAEAIKQNEGDEALEARRIQDKLKSNIDRLKQAKQEISSREESAPRVDPKLMFHAQNWMDDHPWYDPKGSSKDSRVVARLDRALAAEGYDPKDGEYWDELTKRARKALPHRFEDSDDQEDSRDERPAKNGNGSKKTSTGPKFSTGGRERPLAKNEVYITPERKRAMQDAGVWDDKVLRNRYLKNYQKWDRENSPRGRER